MGYYTYFTIRIKNKEKDNPYTIRELYEAMLKQSEEDYDESKLG